MKEHPAVYKRMIAAYVIGYSVTGVIISYNTEAPGVKGRNPVILPGGISINPITWTREETLATAAESLGSRLLDKEKNWSLVKNYADARVDKARGVYHSFDYPFYYYNIRENAANRTAKFLASQW